MCGLDETERSSVQREHTQALYTSHPPRRSGSSQVQTWNLQLVFINIIKSHYHGSSTVVYSSLLHVEALDPLLELLASQPGISLRAQNYECGIQHRRRST
jgi:hypothetical protein